MHADDASSADSNDTGRAEGSPSPASFETEPTVMYVPVDTEAHLDESPEITGLHGWALVVGRGPRAGLTWVLGDGGTTVGRHPDSDIFLDDITVSRHHCRFVNSGDELSVEDSGSTNGTYVNGERVDRKRLASGDEVIVGKFHLLVAVGDA